MKCAMCSTERALHDSRAGRFWGLNGYFGLSGAFCIRCYDKVSHDAYGKPRNKTLYRLALTKLNMDKRNGQNSV